MTRLGVKIMKKRCFVIQGFGKKQDFEQAKLFDLDASYAIIKEAMEETGMECYRADELRGNALIDQVMYDELLDADLVIADVTTRNFNAAFELGVRFALRPYATIVIGEKGMNFPFDINHIYIHTYQHLGEDIGFKEAKRFSKELKELAEKAVNNINTDSPVYTFLKRLPEQGFIKSVKSEKIQVTPAPGNTNATLRDIIDKAEDQMRKSSFTNARNSWIEARELAGKNDYIVQQLALATYKCGQPSPEEALVEAKKILEYLKPHDSFDTETLGLWAAVHKRLYILKNDLEALEEAIFALERGYYIKRDYYNGINLAYLLDIKAKSSKQDVAEELHFIARYIRRSVIEICHEALKNDDQSNEQKYWIAATLYEAYFGLGQGKEKDALQWKEVSEKLSVGDWMTETTKNQIDDLQKVLSNNPALGLKYN